MTPSDLQAVMETAARMGLIAGAFGALYFRAAVAAVALLGRALVAWGARRSRILRARMRNVHGPLLLPDAPRWLSRAVVAAALRRKHQAIYG